MPTHKFPIPGYLCCTQINCIQKNLKTTLVCNVLLRTLCASDHNFPYSMPLHAFGPGLLRLGQGKGRVNDCCQLLCVDQVEKEVHIHRVGDMHEWIVFLLWEWRHVHCTCEEALGDGFMSITNPVGANWALYSLKGWCGAQLIMTSYFFPEGLLRAAPSGVL